MLALFQIEKGEVGCFKHSAFFVGFSFDIIKEKNVLYKIIYYI
jgi:hypothetical protein